MALHSIIVYEVKTYPGRKSPYVVRWKVNRQKFWRSFTHKTAANDLYAALIVGIRARERFSNTTGLPVSLETSNLSVATLAKAFVQSKVNAWEPKTRQSVVGPLSEALSLLVSKNASTTTESRAEISLWLMAAGTDAVPASLKHSLNINDCTPAVCSDVAAEMSYKLNKDGCTRSKTLKAPVTNTRYRRACSQFFGYAVDRELLTKNPWPTARRGKTTRKERQTDQIRTDLLPTHQEAVAALNRVVSHQPRSKAYMVVCALVYYAGLRPGEARALRIEQCQLPEGEWGTATVEQAVKEAPDMYFLGGEERIGPGKTDTRTVSLHPVLVRIIREHIGDRKTGHVCVARNGGPVDQRRLERAWARARGSKTWRVYDLRHAHASLCLRAGIPPVEVARSLGHSVDVLHRVYNGAFPADQTQAKERMQSAFTL